MIAMKTDTNKMLIIDEGFTRNIFDKHFKSRQEVKDYLEVFYDLYKSDHDVNALCLDLVNLIKVCSGWDGYNCTQCIQELKAYIHKKGFDDITLEKFCCAIL